MASTHSLPARPNLEYLKRLAKRQLAEDRKTGKRATLSLAQLAVARRFGFPSWQKLRSHVAALAEQNTSADAPPVNLPHVFRDLMKAIVRRDDASLAQLLQLAPEVVIRTGPHPEWGGRPQPLHVAIEMGNSAAFSALLEAGADVNGDNAKNDLWSPLMLAIHWKRLAMRDELIRRGARVDLVTALMLKDDRQVGRLLKAPAALAGPFPNDATPLHFARTVKSARLLIALGVDPLVKDKYDKTAMDRWAAAKPQSPALMRLAKSLGSQPCLNLPQAVEQGRLATVRQMLRGGADPNARFPTGSQGTLLHSAAWNGNLPMAKLLVSHRADVRAVDLEHKTTPAHWARHALKLFDRKACAAVAEYLESMEAKGCPK